MSLRAENWFHIKPEGTIPHKVQYRWSFREAALAFLKAFFCDCGVERILRRHLQRQGATQIEIMFQSNRTTCLVSGPEDAQPVMLLHGTPGSALSWWTYLKNPGDFRMLAIDRPGFSPFNRNTPDPLADMGILRQALKEATHSRPAILIGHSMGGGLAAKLAMDNPQNVRALVLIGASLDPTLEKTKPIQHSARKAPIKYLLSRSSRNSNEELIKYPEFLKSLVEGLEKIRCPVLLVHALDDGLVPYANVAFMKEHLSGSRALHTCLFEAGGHNIHTKKFTGIIEAVKRLD